VSDERDHERSRFEPGVRLDDPPLPLLVTGIAGVAGYQAFHYFRRLYPGQVIGTRRSDNWPLDGPGVEPCDAGDTNQLARLFDHYQFGAVLNAEGHCKLKSCELDPTLAHRVNVASARALTEVVGRTPVRIVHLSIDLVFSGLTGGPYTESDPPDPVTVYGQTMWETEKLLSAKVDCCILRISLPMGRSFSGHAGAIDWIESRFRNGRPATLYYDEVRTPHYTDCLNRLCHELLANQLAGTYHAGGPRALSLFEIAQVINRLGNYPPELLHGCHRTAAGPVPPRAGDVRLDSTRLTRRLGHSPFDPWPLDPAHLPSDRMWHHHRPVCEHRSPERLHELLCRNQLKTGSS